jgi:alpha-L-glutamate ligase-like protein
MMMILQLLRNLRKAGVLGMNRRNADYIMRCNRRSAFPLVDNKVETKRLARKFGIPVPDVYFVIEHHEQAARFRNEIAERASFVIKPARGAGGSGIVLVQERAGDGFLTPSGKTLSYEEIIYHLSDILSGVFSLEGLEDCAIVESLIHPDPVFAAITYLGVPDVRIIVYRGVPVMAMVRLPTKASDGKANLHRGGIGAGIDMATGLTLSAVHGTSVVTNHPDTGAPIGGIQVPYWDRMLLMAARAYEMTGLGYLGVDLVVDRHTGPLLLELNARPGLAIQIANMTGLAPRLEAVDASSATLKGPDERVGWAREHCAAG